MGQLVGRWCQWRGGVAVAAVAACLCQLLLRVICKLIQLKAAYPYVCVCGWMGCKFFNRFCCLLLGEPSKPTATAAAAGEWNVGSLDQNGRA